MWGREGDGTEQKLRDWNDAIHRVRCGIEKIFGTWKCSYGLRRMRWKGLAKATLQVRLTAIAYNLKQPPPSYGRRVLENSVSPAAECRIFTLLRRRNPPYDPPQRDPLRVNDKSNPAPRSH